ncbi:MAG: hypothetical protein IK087_12535 [Lachnospiraceae bacterium]|nr:hypothetical protein [Lachnospiraceae bacterium]
MITMDRFYNDRLADEYRVPEWVRSERYEFCDAFYEDYTGKKDSKIWTRLSSALGKIFH